MEDVTELINTLVHLLQHFLFPFLFIKIYNSSFQKFFSSMGVPLLEVIVLKNWMLAKLETVGRICTAIYKKFWKCLPNFIICRLLFALTVILRNQKLAFCLVQLLQMMICFGNSSSWGAGFWQLPQYIGNSWQQYTAWN